MKHTEGPWIYKSTKGIYLGVDEEQKRKYAVESPSANSWIVQVDNEANARLIAAAPEMLRELKGLAVYLQHLESHLPKAGATEQLNSCLKVIAKAE